MRTFQFWILIFASIVVSGLMIKQVFLMRELNQLERTLSDSQQVVKDGTNFENAWKQLAMRLYQAGAQDQAVLDLLKKDNVEVRAAKPAAAGAGATGASAAAAPLAPTSSKPSVVSPHPATP